MSDIKLQPILYKDMDILFLALNPPEQSNKNGHYFSSDLTFWNVLYCAGLITEKIFDLFTADEQVFKNNSINYKNSIYGITDLVPVIETNSKKVYPCKKDVIRILRIITDYEPRVLCMMHSKVKDTFFKKKIITSKDYGKVGKCKNTFIYSVPFPKGSNISQNEIVEYYKQMKQELE